MGINRVLKRGSILVFTFLIYIQSAFAQNSILTLLQRLDPIELYHNKGLHYLVDMILGLLIFYNIGYIIFSKVYKGHPREVKIMTVGLGLALSGGLVWFIKESTEAKHLFGLLGAYSYVVFLILLGVFLYRGFIQDEENKWDWPTKFLVLMFMIFAFEEMFQGMTELYPKEGTLIGDVWEAVRAFAIIAGLIAGVMMAIKIIRQAISIGTGGVDGEDDADTRIALERANLSAADAHKAQERTLNRLKNLEKQLEKAHKDRADAIEGIKAANALTSATQDERNKLESENREKEADARGKIQAALDEMEQLKESLKTAQRDESHARTQEAAARQEVADLKGDKESLVDQVKKLDTLRKHERDLLLQGIIKIEKQEEKQIKEELKELGSILSALSSLSTLDNKGQRVVSAQSQQHLIDKVKEKLPDLHKKNELLRRELQKARAELDELRNLNIAATPTYREGHGGNSAPYSSMLAMHTKAKQLHDTIRDKGQELVQHQATKAAGQKLVADANAIYTRIHEEFNRISKHWNDERTAQEITMLTQLTDNAAQLNRLFEDEFGLLEQNLSNQPTPKVHLAISNVQKMIEAKTRDQGILDQVKGLSLKLSQTLREKYIKDQDFKRLLRDLDKLIELERTMEHPRA